MNARQILRATGILGIGAAMVLAGAGFANAGAIYLTGHDVLLHSGQNGYDAVILDFLRGAGTASEIATGDYTISVVGSGVGFANFNGGPGFAGNANGSAISLSGTLAGYGGATYYNTGADGTTPIDWNTVLAADALIILSHTNCGGCDLSTAGSAAINAQAGAIATAFNGGMDIWGISGASLASYYDFLPPGAVATGLPISGSSGFVATPAGVGLGIVPGMINGFPTHNRFTGFDSDFTVFETRPIEPGVPDEVISIGITDARIVDDIIVTDMPEPATLTLSGLGLLVIAFVRRRRNDT